MGMRRQMAVTLALLAGLTLSTFAPAYAAPGAVADIDGQVANAQTRLDALNDRSKVALERYNASRLDLARGAQEVSAAQARVADADQALRRQQALVGAFASAAYRDGATQQAAAITAMIGTADLQSFLEGMAALDAVARRQRQALDGLAVARHAVEGARAAATAALRGHEQAAARVATAKATVEGDVARMQALLGGLRAQQAELVRWAEAAAAQAAAQQQAAARAAAEQAAAAARARQAALDAQAAAVAAKPVLAAPRVPTATVPVPGPVPAPVPAPVPPPRTGGLNWAALAQCESGGDPTSVSYGGLYRGLYQFTLGTWASVGGVGDPAAATPAEQTYRAQLLYDREGRTPWPVCGKYL
ncbi:MAG: hypothetical protein NVSMB13_19510 [Mycobacteriales bacterium]